MTTIPVIHGATADRPDEADTLAVAADVAAALIRLGHTAPVVHVGTDLSGLAALADRPPALVFNLVEALDGDDARAAEVPALLDRLGLRFTGCGVAGFAACLTKPAMKARLVAAGLPTPAWSMTGAGLDPEAMVIVKSATAHASLGMDAGSVVPGHRAAAEIAARTRAWGGVFFAETFVEGREFNLSLLDGPDGLSVLPPAEIRFLDHAPGAPRIVDYAAKWLPDSHGYSHTPRRFDFPPGDRGLIGRLVALAEDCWAALDLSGYARVDFRVDGAGRAWILEANTNPCLASDAGFVAAAARAGIGFDALVARIVAGAEAD